MQASGRLLPLTVVLLLAGHFPGLPRKPPGCARRVDVPESWTSNLASGGKDRSTLFSTASDSLYSIRTRVYGAR